LRCTSASDTVSPVRTADKGYDRALSRWKAACDDLAHFLNRDDFIEAEEATDEPPGTEYRELPPRVDSVVCVSRQVAIALAVDWLAEFLEDDQRAVLAEADQVLRSRRDEGDPNPASYELPDDNISVKISEQRIKEEGDE
jgi:hypothetical protein